VLHQGSVVGGRYEIVDLLGGGEMKQIWLAGDRDGALEAQGSKESVINRFASSRDDGRRGSGSTFDSRQCLPRWKILESDLNSRQI
jgi:hypothetical protein